MDTTITTITHYNNYTMMRGRIKGSAGALYLVSRIAQLSEHDIIVPDCAAFIIIGFRDHAIVFFAN